MQPYFQREFRELGHVPRWQIARTIQKQDVAQHSYYVGLYADRAAHMLNLMMPSVRLAILQWAIYHDLPEAGIGDIQAPTKRRMDTDDLGLLEQSYVQSRFGQDTLIDASMPVAYAVVKFADMLDQVMFVASEIQMGNQTLGRSLLEPRHPSKPECVTSMIMRHLKKAFDGLTEFNQSDETMDYMWRTYVIPSIIENTDLYSHIIQDKE